MYCLIFNLLSDNMRTIFLVLWETVNNCCLITFSMPLWFMEFYHIPHQSSIPGWKASSYSLYRNCSTPLIILPAFLCNFSGSNISLKKNKKGEGGRSLESLWFGRAMWTHTWCNDCSSSSFNGFCSLLSPEQWFWFCGFFGGVGGFFFSGLNFIIPRSLSSAAIAQPLCK